MSLPEIAVFYDIYGNERATQFVNVGWFVGANSITAVLLELDDLLLTDPNNAYFEMYDMSFFVEFVNDIRKMDRNSASMAIEIFYKA